jgi:hypothetical protein
MRHSLFLAAGIALMAMQSAWAAAPAKMTYQGVLRNASGTIVADGTYQLTFKLHDAATLGSAVWTGTQQDVTVSKGLFTAVLSGGTPDLSTFSFDRALFLSITIGAGSELVPRIELTPSPYSMLARGVEAGGVTGSMIANGTIADANISPSAAIAGTKISPTFSGNVSGGSFSSGGNFSGAGFTADRSCNTQICFAVDMFKAVFTRSGIPDTKFRVTSGGDVFADGGYLSPAADYADMMNASAGAASIGPGDVLTIDPASPQSVIRSTEARSTLVAGIYSTRPAFVGAGREWDDPVQGQEDETIGHSLADVAARYELVPVALTGIVPCRVSAENGPIRPGVLLVTSATPGHAMRDDNPRPGTILGKALESLESGTGTIKVLVALH